MQQTAIVVPCFNEAQRLPVDAFESACSNQPNLRLHFVDDGSTDETLALLRAMERKHPAQISVVRLTANRGKAEAVRAGVLAALEESPAYVGYWDADLATPLEELEEFIDVLDRRPNLDVVFGSRVKLLGRHIERRAIRHYPGRIFATLASIALGLPIYDTQCGAKLFRVTSETMELFEAPFQTRWLFDIEVLGRLIRARRANAGPPAAESIYEVPLRVWRDIPGSKIRPSDFPKAILELVRIWNRYLRKR